MMLGAREVPLRNDARGFIATRVGTMVHEAVGHGLEGGFHRSKHERVCAVPWKAGGLGRGVGG